jgi:hypothetical protein
MTARVFLLTPLKTKVLLIVAFFALHLSLVLRPESGKEINYSIMSARFEELETDESLVSYRANNA